MIIEQITMTDSLDDRRFGWTAGTKVWKVYCPTCNPIQADGFQPYQLFLKGESALGCVKDHYCAKREPEDRYSEEWLKWADSESGRYLFPAAHRYARELNRIPYEHRARAMAVAHTHMNLLGGRMSDALSQTVSTLIDIDFAETWAETEARRYRELDQQARQIKFQAAVAEYAKEGM